MTELKKKENPGQKSLCKHHFGSPETHNKVERRNKENHSSKANALGTVNKKKSMDCKFPWFSKVFS